MFVKLTRSYYVNLLRMWSQDWKKPHQPHHHQRPHWSKKKNQLTWPPRFEYFAGYLSIHDTAGLTQDGVPTSSPGNKYKQY